MKTYYWQKTRVEKHIGHFHIHSINQMHEVTSVISGYLRTTGYTVILDDTIGIQGQQFHTLGQHKLAGRRRVGTVFAVTGQNLGNLIRDVLSHLFGVGIQASANC